MRKELLSYLSNIPILAGVELRLGEENMAIRYAVLKRKGNTIYLEKGEYHLHSLTQLKAALPASLPIALTISGKGIMHRSLETVDQWKEMDYANKILPNSTLGDFYIQTSLSGSTTFLSLIRKGEINEILTGFKDLGMEILSVTLGPFALQPVWSYLTLPPGDAITIDGHSFTLNANIINRYQMGQPLTDRSGKITFAGEEMNECIVTAYATGLCLMADIDFPAIDLTALNISRGEYNQRAIFKKSSIALLAFFLILLLVNTFVFSHFSSKIDDHGSNDLQVLKTEESDLRRDLNKNRELLSSITRSSDTQYGSLSRIADLLGLSQPLSVILDDMSIFPADKTGSRKERKPVFDFTLVRLSGTCSDGPELNAWIADIRKLDFCKKVEIAKYNVLEKGSANFTLNLFVN